MEDQGMTLVEHLEELRRRLIVCLLAVAACSLVAYPHTGLILGWLAKPAGSLAFFSPAEAFLARLKIAIFGGLFLSAPVLLFEAWGFAAQGLTERERKALFWILPCSYALFCLGAGLALFLVVPTAMRFLLAYGSEEVRPLLGVGPTLEFAGFLSLSFGLFFQLPLVLFFLNWLGLATPFQLSSYRRHVYLGAFVAAAFMTPGPDVFSQLLLAIPVLLLYEISLLGLRWVPWRAKDAQIVLPPGSAANS